MKKLKILKSIFWVWFFLVVCFGGYCLYYLVERIDSLSNEYVEVNMNNKFNPIFFSNVEEFSCHLDYVFRWSILSLIMFFISFIFFIIVFYFRFKDLGLFYACNECTEGNVYIDKCRFNLEFLDLDDNLIENHSQRYQLLYKKIYLKRDGSIDVFFNKSNPKRFIIGNKPTYLVNFFIKPFFLDLFIFILLFASIYLFRPFLFFNLL